MYYYYTKFLALLIICTILLFIFSYFIRIIPKNSLNIAIVVVVEKADRLQDYDLAVKTLKCYAQMQHYTLVYLNTDGRVEWALKCQQKDFMFQRHCFTYHFMKENLHFHWILFLDGDIGVINPRHRIEEFVDEAVDLIFYNRLYNWEITAGTYLARNTIFARDFLKYWANYYFHLLPNTFHGTDNGALHEVFMHKFTSVQQIIRCDKLYFKSSSYADLFGYEACVRATLGGLERQIYIDSKGLTIKIMAKGQAWCRDGGEQISPLWSAKDFMLHGWKKNKMDVLGQGRDAWIFPFKRKNFDETICNQPIAEVIARNWDYKDELRISDNEREKLLADRINRANQGYFKAKQEAENFLITSPLS